jgi:predicted lactoylglutathione lyase
MMYNTPVVVSLPIADRRTSFTFYRDGLGFAAPGEPWGDGIPEPLQFALNDGVRVMLIPTGAFDRITGDHQVAPGGTSECVLVLATGTDEGVDEVIQRAQAAGADVITPPGQQPWGYAGAFADPDGHIWMVRSEGQVTHKITVTADRKRIVGWQDGTTAARILWRDVGGVHGRWADDEQLAMAILLAFTGPSPRYPLVSTELVSAVTVEDLEAAIAPGNRGVVQVQAEVKTRRCTCADEVLYTVKMDTTVHGPMPWADAQDNADYLRAENPGAEVTMESCRNPDYRPDCLGYILEDEAYVKYLRAARNPRNPWHGEVYCQRCAIGIWGE